MVPTTHPPVLMRYLSQMTAEAEIKRAESMDEQKQADNARNAVRIQTECRCDLQDRCLAKKRG